jgi:hypothetical protein
MIGDELVARRVGQTCRLDLDMQVLDASGSGFGVKRDRIFMIIRAMMPWPLGGIS